MKKKINKKLLARIGAILACVLLVGALAIPCFADYSPTPNPDEGAPGVSDGNDGQPSPSYNDADVVSAFLEYKSVSSTDPLYKLMTYGSYVPDSTPWVFQFATNMVAIESAYYITFSSMPLAFGDVYCYYQPTGQYYIINDGWWTTSHTTTDGNKFVYFDFNTLVDGTTTRSLRIRFKIDNDTGEMLSVEYVFDEYGTFGGAQMLCATAVTADNIVPLAYGQSMNLLVPYKCLLSDYRDFSSGYSKSYDDGYAEGREEWREHGLDEGYYLGYTEGYMEGYDKGYDDGELDGYDDGYNDGSDANTGYQNGYNDAVAQIESGDFGRNFLGGLFSAPIEALKSFTLVEWTTTSGLEVSLNVFMIISAAIGVSLFIWFIKLFAGG